ncbi:MAG: HYExAFE family protein [Planctomycetota bacterium]|nr:HYExAFE family protein [Planctomycetota bacterium]
MSLPPLSGVIRMAQRRFHYEQAFEHYLRANRVPYVVVDEAKKTLLPARTLDGVALPESSLKSFDFVVYQPKMNLLVDIKGRQFGSVTSASSISNRRLESWVTREDVDGLLEWQRLFGSDFKAVFVFAYCLRQQPPDVLFEEVFSYGDRWYALREVMLDDYEREMVLRSPKWRTVHIPRLIFDKISRPFTVRQTGTDDLPCRSR